MSRDNDRLARQFGRLILFLYGPRPLSRDEKKERGLRYCRFPGYGSKWSRGRSVPDEKEMAVIQRIVALRDGEGLSWYKIAARLLHERVLTRDGREWSPHRVRRAYLATVRQRAADPIQPP